VQLLRLKVRVREMMLAVGCVALFLALFLRVLGPCLTWLWYPHVKVKIFNETSAALCDVRIKFMNGVRTAERIEPGSSAVTEIQSGGDAGVFMSYRDSSGVIKADEPLHYSDENGTLDRGFLEVHVTKEGTRLVRGIYTAIWFDVPGQVRVSRTGQLNLE
jgi:hypothetical protein